MSSIIVTGDGGEGRGEGLGFRGLGFSNFSARVFRISPGHSSVFPYLGVNGGLGFRNAWTSKVGKVTAQNRQTLPERPLFYIPLGFRKLCRIDS